MGAIPTLEELRAGCDELDGIELLMVLAGPGGPLFRRTALVSSFGAESSVLLHIVACVDRATPVIFLDTGKHFPETLAYRDQLVEWFGLTNLVTARPDQLSLAQNDRHEQLFADDPDLCCHIRKTEPLESALRGFAAWITGRKRFQGGLRSSLATIETEPAGGRLKLNPLANWSAERIEAYRRDYGLPVHPLAERGYRSSGCAPCTRPVRSGEASRAGRWSGMDKLECGIHRPAAESSPGDQLPLSAWAMPIGSPHRRDALVKLPGSTLSRFEVLAPLLDRFAAAAGMGTIGGGAAWTRPAEAVVADATLRGALCADPALAALLPGFHGKIGFDRQAAGLCVGADGTVGLNPALCSEGAALTAAARWGMELAEVERVSRPMQLARAEAALLHGAGLPGLDTSLARDLLPPAVVEALTEARRATPRPSATRALATLLASPRVVDLQMEPVAPEAHPLGAAHLALARPLEQILTAGGDARLRVDPRRDLNRYGTAPRPRPEAIHFSSSTASSISDYGFLLCDEIRRGLLREDLEPGEPGGALWQGLAEGIRAELSAFLALRPGQADIVLAPSGTDTEFLAVLLALGGSEGRPLTNILIAPEETGRGVALAGEGRYFDDSTALGLPTLKGRPAWPERQIESYAVAIREPSGRVRPTEAIVLEVQDAVEQALAAGHQVLIHVLIGSKTGISAPPIEIVDTLRMPHRDRVDVVVDACQLRVTPSLLGALARRGWMLQVSGSKFLTGPPFSAALIVPEAMRGRRSAVAALLADAPALSRPEDWPSAWQQAFADRELPPVSFGKLMRWVAALGEAQLLKAVPRAVYKTAFERFRTALHQRLEASRVLVPLPTPDRHLSDLGEEAPGLAARSIICFALAMNDTASERRLATLEECQLLFELLNSDVTPLLAELTAEERRLLARPMHIGQPVALRPDSPEAPTVLRLVVGARFFTIVGFPADGDVNEAIEGEIADAVAAIDKLELLVARFAELAAARSRLETGAPTAPKTESELDAS